MTVTKYIYNVCIFNMYIYIYMCVCVCVYVCVCVCAYVFMWLYMLTYVHSYTHARVDVCWWRGCHNSQQLFIKVNFIQNQIYQDFIISIIRIHIIVIIIYSLEFFTSAIADGLSLEFEWQQVSSSLQDTSQYSGRSQ